MTNFLTLALEYAEARGDSDMFNKIYEELRETFSINESVWKTISCLYNVHIAIYLDKEFSDEIVTGL